MATFCEGINIVRKLSDEEITDLAKALSSLNGTTVLNLKKSTVVK